MTFDPRDHINPADTDYAELWHDDLTDEEWGPYADTLGIAEDEGPLPNYVQHAVNAGQLELRPDGLYERPEPEDQP